MKSDSEIIHMFISRDENAVACISNKFSDYCFVIANNILSDRESAKECLNDTWLAVWQSIPPQSPRCLRAFLGKITRNIALNRYNERQCSKRGAGETALVLDELIECVSDGSIDPEKRLLDSEAVELLNSFLRSLPEKERDIFIQRYFYFYSTSEIAKYHGMRENYLRTVLSRTRAKLKKYFEERNYCI